MAPKPPGRGKHLMILPSLLSRAFPKRFFIARVGQFKTPTTQPLFVRL
jgi:hypothetical protein